MLASTCSTTVGAAYVPAAGAAVLIGVDSTAASVAAAIDKIAAGSLAGQVPGQGLVNALAAAQTAEAAVHTGNTAAVDALVTKLAAPILFANGDSATATATDPAVLGANPTYGDKVEAITADAKAFRDKVSGESTGVLTTKANEASTAVETARTALSADAKIKAATYENAITANAALKLTDATQVAAVKAGLAADAGFAGVTTALKALTGFGAIDNATPVTAAATLYEAYVAATADQRNAADAVLKDVAYFGTFKAAATTDITKNAANTAEGTAKAAIDLADGNDAGANAAGEFSAILKAKTDAAATLVKAQAADVDVAAVKAITDANKVASEATAKAGTNIDAFNTANAANNVAIKGIIPATVTVDTVKETFYFADKAGLTAGTDYAVGSLGATTQFGAGDSIVLGAGYAFNAGALSTGNNNALEFFLVKSDAGVQVVVESTVAGTTNAVTNATTGAVTSTGTDTVSVITLTGVTADHLSVANGVVSYV